MPHRPARDPRLPVTLITGFLGAEKSTLLNALIRHPDFADAAILVNEFGNIGIDSALIRSVDGTVTTLAAGCVCCAMRGELITALKDLHFKRVRGEVPEFTRLAIETSGFADPAPIFATLLNEPVLASVYRIDGIVAVIDGEHGAVQLDCRAEAVAQAAIAAVQKDLPPEIGASGLGLLSSQKGGRRLHGLGKNSRHPNAGGILSQHRQNRFRAPGLCRAT